MDFPHLADNEFPKLDTEGVYDFKNNFDYTRWKKGVKVRLLNVPWDESYENVVKFENDEERDQWFEEQHDALVFYLNAETRIESNGTVKLPVPYNTINTFDYIEVTFPEPTSDDEPLAWSNTSRHINKMHFFIIDTLQKSPNAVELRLKNDWWTTYINKTDIKRMSLERGHAPMTKTTVDEYLEDPVHNSEYLLAPDVNFEDYPTYTHKGFFKPLGTGKKYLCLVLKIAPSKLKNLGKGILQNKEPSVGSYYFRAGRYENEEYKEGEMPPPNDDWNGTYDWEHRDLYNTWPQDLEQYITVHDDNWNFGNIDPSGITPDISHISSPDYWNLGPSIIAIDANKADKTLETIEENNPWFFDLIVCGFMATDEFIILSVDPLDCLNLGDVEIYEVMHGAAGFNDKFKFKKEDFHYGEKYADLTKLYTSPYAMIEIKDEHTGAKAEIEIERTSKNGLSLDLNVSLVFPFLNFQILLQGANGDFTQESSGLYHTSSYLVHDVHNQEQGLNHTFCDYDFISRYDFPCFEIYAKTYNREMLNQWYENSATHNRSKTAEYWPSTHSVNNEYAERVHMANLDYYNKTGDFIGGEYEDYTIWQSPEEQEIAKEHQNKKDGTIGSAYKNAEDTAETNKTNTNETANVNLQNALDTNLTNKQNSDATADNIYNTGLKSASNERTTSNRSANAAKNAGDETALIQPIIKDNSNIASDFSDVYSNDIEYLNNAVGNEYNNIALYTKEEFSNFQVMRSNMLQQLNANYDKDDAITQYLIKKDTEYRNAVSNTIETAADLIPSGIALGGPAGVGLAVGGTAVTAIASAVRANITASNELEITHRTADLAQYRLNAAFENNYKKSEESNSINNNQEEVNNFLNKESIDNKNRVAIRINQMQNQIELDNSMLSAQATVQANTFTRDAAEENADDTYNTDVDNLKDNRDTAKDNANRTKKNADDIANRNKKLSDDNASRTRELNRRIDDENKNVSTENESDWHYKTLDQAERKRWIGEFASQRRFEADFQDLKAKNDSLRLSKPYSVSNYKESPLFAYIYDNSGIQITLKTQSAHAIAQAGDFFKRYGYALNCDWEVRENYGGLNLMTYFTYWKANEVWLSTANAPNQAGNAIKDIFKKGVTVWRAPENINNVQIYLNKPVMS